MNQQELVFVNYAKLSLNLILRMGLQKQTKKRLQNLLTMLGTNVIHFPRPFPLFKIRCAPWPVWLGWLECCSLACTERLGV